MTTLPISERALPAVANVPPLLVVPVDSTPAAQRAVALAAVIARRDGAGALLVGLAPTGPAMDMETLQARLTLAEYGVVAPAVSQALDDEACLTRALRALLPARQRLAAAGIPVTIRMLSSANPAAELRGLLVSTRGALVLANPPELGGALLTLTGNLLSEPPCTVYVAGLARPARPPRWRILSRLLRQIWQPRG